MISKLYDLGRTYCGRAAYFLGVEYECLSGIYQFLRMGLSAQLEFWNGGNWLEPAYLGGEHEF